MKKVLALITGTALLTSLAQGQLLTFQDSMDDGWGPYTTEYPAGDGTNFSEDTDSDGDWGLTAQAGGGWIRWGATGDAYREGNIRLTDGFDHEILPGQYTASISLGNGGGDVEDRDTFTSFELRLETTDGVEIGDPTIINPYEPPEPTEWDTITVEYDIGPDSPVLGETLTWGATAIYDSDEPDTFTAMDNVEVSYVPEPSTYALIGGMGVFLTVLLVRRRKASVS